MNCISNWYNQRFATKDAAIFVITVIIAALILTFFGDMLAPLLASIVIAFLLESIVNFLIRYIKISRNLAVFIVFGLFVAALFSIILILLPLMASQLSQLVKALPESISALKQAVSDLTTKYPKYISSEQINYFLNTLSNINISKVASFGQTILSVSLASLPTIFAVLIYLFLVPLLVLFFMKDKDTIISWMMSLLPKENGALLEVWADLKPQLANYVKGKAVEMVLVAFVTYIGFVIFGLNYALLLAVCVGFSVVIPYIGMVAVTIPVIIIGLMQYGTSTEFVYMFIVYLVIQALDGNLLVPLLYSEAVSLHPVAVIAAVLIFGGIWGFWGLFFAIPLAALTNAGLKMWSRRKITNLDDSL